MATRRKPGIFCVEGGWSSKLTSEASVLPLLEFLRSVGQIRFVHDEVHTLDAFAYVVDKWPQRQYASYSIGYFGFHGVPGSLLLGRRKITLEDMAEQLRGRCAGKIIYFGSCRVIDVPKKRLEDFRRITKARAVAGYEEDVDWFESAAFDLVLFDALTRYKHLDATERWITQRYGRTAKQLGFRLLYG
jgi:hypothetical protein